MGRTLLFVALMLTGFGAANAFAKEVDGAFGIGYDQSLGGVSGIKAIYWVGDVGIQGIFGLDFVKSKENGKPLALVFGLSTFYNFATSENANLSFGLGVDFGYANRDYEKPATFSSTGAVAAGQGSGQSPGGGSAQTGTTNDASFQVNISLPLRFEYFFSDAFAINLATGISIAIIPKKGQVLGDAANSAKKSEDVGVRLGAGSLFGNAGFTYYF